MKLVYFIGRNRVGKTTLSRTLVRILVESGISAEVVSFATELRREVVVKYGIPESVVFDKSIDKSTTMFDMSTLHYGSSMPDLWNNSGRSFNNVMSLRDILINHGNVMRYYNRDYWVRKVQSYLKHTSSEIIVIDDSRYDNEFNIRDDSSIFFVENFDNLDYSDEAQESVLNWLTSNKYRILADTITPVPLTDEISDSLIRRDVIPILITRGVLPS